MTDSVTSNSLLSRLRELHGRVVRGEPALVGSALQDAADEIERLQREQVEDADRMERAAIAIEDMTRQLNERHVHEPCELRAGLERAIEILSKADCYTAHGARDSGLAFADISTEHVKAFRDHMIDKLDEAIGSASPPGVWRSVENDPPRGTDVVVTFDGDAFSCEYADAVSRRYHKAWMQIPLVKL